MDMYHKFSHEKLEGNVYWSDLYNIAVRHRKQQNYICLCLSPSLGASTKQY